MGADPLPYRLRQVTVSPEELQCARRVRLEALQTDPTAFGGTYAQESQRSTEAWQAWLVRVCSPGQCYVVAAVADDTVGSCGAFVTAEHPSVGMLWGMFVRPSHRGSGMAAALVGAAEAFLAQQGVVQVTAHVMTTNARALRFYQRLGYVQGATLAPTTATGRPVVVIARRLDRSSV